ncbi:MAG TPA: ABC transporter ATP-binding protein [Baekduia sp.]|jgi:peptide/nickel transport system ATP-binding protein
MAGSGTAHLRAPEDVLLRVEGLEVQFPFGRGQYVHAVSDVSFDLARGETLGLVGESGSGKSTTALAVMRLLRTSASSIHFDGTDLATTEGEELRKLRPRFQMIFQDPASSVNPRRTVSQIVAEPLKLWRRDARDGWKDTVAEMLDAVGLDVEATGDRRAHEFSGGQLQRVCIARALVMQPELLVADEPVSALDVSIQAQIVNLLKDMKDRYGLTMLFIAHDLAVVKNISNRVAVMYVGKLCEIGDVERIYARPAHPYTRALLDSSPRLRVDRSEVAPAVTGDIPSPANPPSGCRFHTRCPHATDVCRREEPVMRQVAADQFMACHHPLVD